MKLEFNINNYVEFELTERGAKIMNDRNEWYEQAYPNVKVFQNKPKHAKGETMKMQLWDVLQTFGEYTTLGMETFCKDVIIRLSEKDLK